MTLTLQERPAALIEPVSFEAPPCERMQTLLAEETPASWISKAILKSYVSSFNHCLSELGWVPQRILEVGTGDGTLLSYAAQLFMNAEVIGVEFDPVKVEMAKEKNCCRIEFLHLHNEETLPFEDNAFDLVISHGFLGKTPIPRHWMNEMKRVSAEALIVSTPMPAGFKWMRRMPGAEKAFLIGQPVFSQGVQPIRLTQLKSWAERLGLVPESILNPLPYSMMLARKAQPAKASA